MKNLGLYEDIGINYMFMRISKISPGSTPKPHSRRGFTIIELVMVIALLSIIAGFVIYKSGGIYNNSLINAAEFQAKQSFKTPLLKYRIDVGRYPSTAEGLKALLNAPSERGHLWKGPYVEEIPDDPWKTPYEYVCPGVKNPDGYDIRSAGPDLQFNTADDIGNWKKTE